MNDIKIPSHLSKEFIEKEKIRLWTVALQSRLELASTITNTKWVFVSDMNGIKYWKREEPLNNTTHSSKSEIIVNKSTSTVMSFMNDFNRLHLWNKYFSSCKKICDLMEVKNVFQDSVLLHGSPHLWLPGRDSCLVKFNGPHPHQPKTYARVIRSVETPLCPEVPGYMRTQLLSGFTVEELDPHTTRITNVIIHDFKMCDPPSIWDSWLVPFIVKCDSWTINKMEKLKHFLELEPEFAGEVPLPKRPTKKQQKQLQKKEKAEQPFKNLVFINNFVDKNSSEIITTTSVLTSNSNNNNYNYSTSWGNNNNSSNKRKMEEEEEEQQLQQQKQLDESPKIDFNDTKLFSFDPKKKSEDLLQFLDDIQNSFQPIQEKNGISIMGLVVPEDRINFTNLSMENNNNNSINNNNISANSSNRNMLNINNNNNNNNLNSVNNLLNNTVNNGFDGIKKYQDIQDYIKSQSIQNNHIYIYKAKFKTHSSPSSILFSLLDGDKRRNWGRPFVTVTNEINMSSLEVRSEMKYFTNGKSTTIPLDYHLRVSQNILSNQFDYLSYFKSPDLENNYNNNNNNSFNNNNILVTLEERSNGDMLLVKQENLTHGEERQIEFIMLFNFKNWAWSNVIVDNQPLTTNQSDNNFSKSTNNNTNHKQYNANNTTSTSPFKLPIVNYNFIDRMAMNTAIFFRESIDEEWWKSQQQPPQIASFNPKQPSSFNYLGYSN